MEATFETEKKATGVMISFSDTPPGIWREDKKKGTCESLQKPAASTESKTSFR